MTQIQAVNDLGNLIFIVFLLATVILTVLIAYRKFRGRGTRGLSWAIFIGLIAYAAILVGVSLDSQSRELALGTDKCFDDWCATVTGARSLPKLSARDDMKLVAITLRVSNRARRAAFRPSQPRVALVLSDGGVFTPSLTAQGEFEMQAGPQEDLAKRLLAGDGFQTTLVFEVPAATQEASIVVLEGPAAVTRFLVGDESSFFHKKMLYRIRLE